MVTLTSILSRISRKVLDLQAQRQFNISLDRIGSEIDRYKSTEHPLRILFAPPFAIYSPNYLHDRLISYGLRLRGATVIPVFCDMLQDVQCNVYGGVWQPKTNFRENCKYCVNSARRLWKDQPTPLIALSEHISAAELTRIMEQVLALPDDSWHIYHEDDLSFGKWARDILVNNYVVADYTLIPDHERLGRAHLQNLLILKAAYTHILDVVRPDRVVSNDSYYGMWAVLQHLCMSRGIPFYSYWPVGKTRTAVAFNDAAMSLDFRVAWPKFISQPLTPGQQGRVDEWMGSRLGKRDVLIATHQVETSADVAAILSHLEAEKPTALLPSNVIWDLAALNKQVVFADMMEWIIATIDWFRGHPQFQLIIKTHPAELHPAIPETRERVEVVLKDRGVTLPDNVWVLSPRVSITAYQLFPLIKLGIVHTTTTGSEMVAEGIPVITTGRAPYRGFGFTHDPEDRADYFSLLDNLLSSPETVDESQQQLACKFIYFQNFVYYSDLEIMESEWQQLAKPKVTQTTDILPGKLSNFDYLLDSIISGQPILSADRFPSDV